MNTVLVERVLPTGQTIQIVQGDITTEEVDAIVNAANEHLQHGGGVAWAISKKGGTAIQKESDEWIRRHGPVSHSRPAWTSGGRLPAKYVIHTVGPVWVDSQSEEVIRDTDNQLAIAVTGSLVVADELKCSSLAVPAISTGIFGFPRDRAASILYFAIEKYFGIHPTSGVKVIKLVLYDAPTVDTFLQTWNDKWGRQA